MAFWVEKRAGAPGAHFGGGSRSGWVGPSSVRKQANCGMA